MQQVALQRNIIRFVYHIYRVSRAFIILLMLKDFNVRLFLVCWELYILYIELLLIWDFFFHSFQIRYMSESDCEPDIFLIELSGNRNY